MPVIVVTGTGTEIGKTVTTAAVAALALAAGRSVAVLKPAQTGVAAGEPGDVAVPAAEVEDVVAGSDRGGLQQGAVEAVVHGVVPVVVAGPVLALVAVPCLGLGRVDDVHRSLLVVNACS